LGTLPDPFFALLYHLKWLQIQNFPPDYQRAAGSLWAASTALRSQLKMSVARKLGTLVFFGVPAVIGGGIVFALFNESLAAMWIFEILLAVLAGAVVSR
jgi:hypothetical protein